MRKLAVGYFLCVANSSVFLTGGATIYLALITYPVSVVLRALGWRELARSVKGAGVTYLAVGVLGGLTYLLVAGALVLQSSDLGGQMILAAAIPWTIYSLVEAAWYVRLGRISRRATFYAAPVSVPAVLYFDSIALALAGRFQLPEGPSGAFIAMGALLMLSAALAGASFLRLSPELPYARGTRVPQTLLRPPALRPPAGPGPRVSTTTAPPYLRDHEETAQTSPARVKVEVVSRGTSVVCGNCGRESPLASDACTFCGQPFQKARYGLRCPVCSAPLRTAKRISSDRFVCTQCFSDLRVHLSG